MVDRGEGLTDEMGWRDSGQKAVVVRVRYGQTPLGLAFSCTSTFRFRNTCYLLVVTRRRYIISSPI